MAKKLKGNITNTGYWPNSPDRNNDYNIIPSNEITMEGMNMPLVGISNTGDIRVMRPNENHKFNGNYVTEFPMKKQNDPGWGVQTTPTYPSKYPLDPGFGRSTPKPNQQAIDEWEKIVNSGKNDFLKRVPTSNDPLFNELKRRNENMNQPIFLGKFKYANGGLVKMQPGGPNDELAKFSKQPVNTNDLRYVGSQQAIQDNARPVVPNIQLADKKAPAVKKEAQRVNTEMKARKVSSPAEVYAQEEAEAKKAAAKETAEDKLFIMNQLKDVERNFETIGFDPLQAAELMDIAEKMITRAKTKYPDDKQLLAVLDKRMNFLGQNLMQAPIKAPKILKAAQDFHDIVNYDESKEQQVQDKHYKRLNAFLTKEKAKFKMNPGTIDPALVKFRKEGGDISVPDLKRVKIKSLPRSWKSQ